MKTKLLLSAMILSFGVVSYGQWVYNYLPEARGRMGAAVLGDKIYFAGGADNSNHQLSAIDVYDARLGSWDPYLDLRLSIPRSHPAGVATGTKIFFAGGCNFSDGTMYSRVDKWDTISKTWDSTELSTPRVFLSAVTNGEKVLFAGGNNLLGSSYDVVDIYDLNTGLWEISALSQSRSGMGAAVLGDLAFFAGGYLDETSSVTDQIDIYHFSTGTWTTATLSQARGFLTAVTVRNKVLFAGGTKGDNQPSDRVDIYDGETGTWSTASLSIPRALFPDPASAVINNRKACFTSGGHFSLYTHNWSTFFNRVDIYDDSTGTWSIDSLSQSLVLQTVAGTGNYLVVAGGMLHPSGLFTDKVEIMFDNVVWAGLDKHPAAEGEFMVYPNPSSGKIHLRIGGNQYKAPQVSVFDMQGRQVLARQLSGISRPLDLPLPAGVYLLRVIADKEVYSELITISP